MNKNSTPNPITPEERETFVLGLLSLLCQAEGHTFSWYTSKKGRTWVALKENGNPPYSTSCEYSSSLSEGRTLDTLAILMRAHCRKVVQIEPPITSWVSGVRKPEEYADAWVELGELASELFARWRDAGATTEATLLKLLAMTGITLPPAPSQT